MAAPEFVYQDPLPIQKDTTQYRLLIKSMFPSLSSRAKRY
jgi:hypothetical protein